VRNLGVNLAVALALACSVAGCSSTSVIDNLPSPIGLPASAPARSETPPAFLPVHDMPPPHENKLLNEEELRKAQAEMTALRDRQEAREGKGAKKGAPRDDGSASN
jgi:hypothetical protein